MKYRKGFVSNSSSTSFVAVGFEFDDNNLSIAQKLYLLETNLDISLYNKIYKQEESKGKSFEEIIDYIYDDYKYKFIRSLGDFSIFGKVIATDLDYELDSIELDKLIEYKTDIDKIKNILLINNQTKLYYGSYPS